MASVVEIGSRLIFGGRAAPVKAFLPGRIMTAKTAPVIVAIKVDRM